jgi:hypothetical protein
VLRFVDYWKALTGKNPEWLYFDSKLTTCTELSELNSCNINFVTIRRRGITLMARLRERPETDWTSAVIDIPKRRQKRVRYLEQQVTLDNYEGTLRQIAVKGLKRSLRRRVK